MQAIVHGSTNMCLELARNKGVVCLEYAFKRTFLKYVLKTSPKLGSSSQLRENENMPESLMSTLISLYNRT